MAKHRDQGSIKESMLFGDSQFQKVRKRNYHVRDHGSRQETDMRPRELTGNGMGF